MSDARIDPSGLHFKRELTALRKARCLRDPETSSSWRSPVSYRSVAAAAELNCVNKSQGDHNITNGPFGFFHSEPNLPLEVETKRKKVFLYNWRQHSGKSSDSGRKFDQENEPEAISGNPEDASSYMHVGNSKYNTHLGDPTLCSRGNQENGETPSRRVGRKLKTSDKHKTSRNLIVLKSMGPSCNSVDQSDDTECNSEEITPYKFLKKIQYPAHLGTSLSHQCENWSSSSKFLRTFPREDPSFSYTPASNNSYSRYSDWCPSTFESFGGATASLDDEVDHLGSVRSQGCVPGYWSKSMRNRSIRDCFSPSLSDTLRSSILCGNQKFVHKGRRSPTLRQQKRNSKSTHSLPLLANNCDGSKSSLNSENDELSINFGELKLEASSRLDGRTWSTCGSQNGLEVTVAAGSEDATKTDRCSSQKYRPISFEDLVGQSIVVQSLKNSVVRGRIAPVYLFQGPRGTGKTSAARIFSAALNCLSTEVNKPCGLCRECTDFTSGKSTNMGEVDATNKKGIDKVKHLVKKVLSGPPMTRYKIFIINECHLLPVNAWSSFLKFREEPSMRIIFIFITSEIDKLPHTVLTHCRRYLFPKVKDVDIVTRLKKLAMLENLEVEADALNLMASNSDGSVRDAEIMLDQLSLLGKEITTSHVYDLIGVVSEDKLLDLLELAMSSNTAETVTRARELLDSGVDPIALMTQLAGLIMDIIAGCYHLMNSKCNDSVFSSQSLTETELHSLKQALKILSEAEKQLRSTTDRSTWFTAALVQLGSGRSPDYSYAGSTNKQSQRKILGHLSESAEGSLAHSKNHEGLNVSNSNLMLMASNEPFLPFSDRTSHGVISHISSKELDKFSLSRNEMDDIWRRCVEKCHSRTLRQLLCSHGKLVSILESTGVMTAYIAFSDDGIKIRAERFLRSITNSFELVLKRHVEIKIGCVSDCSNSLQLIETSNTDKLNMLQGTDTEQVVNKDNLIFANEQQVRPARISFRGSCDGSTASRKSFEGIYDCSDEQKLESAWLQAVEKATPGSLNRFRAERNQVLPQDGFYPQEQKQNDSVRSLTLSYRRWEIDQDADIKYSRNSERRRSQRDQVRQRLDTYPLSPSFLHTASFSASCSKEHQGYESGPGCSGLLCWKASKSPTGKVQQKNHVRSHKRIRTLLFSRCRKSKSVVSRSE